MPTAGKKFREAVANHRPLQIAGTINAYSAILARDAGFKAIYLSGAGVANASFGLPDLGVTSLNDVVTDAGRITSAVDLPLLVDADTGWGHALTIYRTVKELTRCGAAGLHIEDQPTAKRCGHRPGKAVVSTGEMMDRVKACVDARIDDSFVIMARTDAIACEGIDAAIERCQRYVEIGADMIFAEAVADPEEYRRFTDAVSVPVLANMTEFGKSPLMSVTELAALNVAMVLYPLSAFRAMSKAALNVYQTIRSDGTQAAATDSMQTREELYEMLGYKELEQQMDQYLGDQENVKQ